MGVYQRDYGEYELLFSYWDGEQWGWTQPGTAKQAAEYRYPPSPRQQVRWRGLPRKAA